MSEQGVALADVRRAIERSLESVAEQTHAAWGATSRQARIDADREVTEAQTALDAALAAAEARIGRLARFVKADDAVHEAVRNLAIFDGEAYDVAWAEKEAARAAILDEDLA